MYARTITYTSSSEARIDIISDSEPSVFPLNTDNISNMRDGVRLAAGTTIYLIDKEKSYILGENSEWSLVPESGGGGGGADGRPATNAEVTGCIYRSTYYECFYIT